MQVMLGSMRDLAPIVAVILFFQLLVLQQPLPDVERLLAGVLFVVFGLTFFIYGLELGLFPIGEAMAHALARKGSVFWLLVFAFTLGFGTTIAEPALIAVVDEAARAAANGKVIENTEIARQNYANGLRYTVAISVGTALVIGVVRILKNCPMHLMLA